MIEVTLPFPPTELSPNSRLHWAKLAKAKKTYRQACWAQTLEQISVRHQIPDGPLQLSLEFVKPTMREMDRDNLLARMKSGLDGMCDALKIDDKRFNTVIVRVAPDRIGGFVKILIESENHGNQKSL